MVVIKFNSKTKVGKILHDGDSIECLSFYDNITDKFESLGQMMVNEFEVDKLNLTRIREFANHDGHIFDLIICGGFANKISVTK